MEAWSKRPVSIDSKKAPGAEEKRAMKLLQAIEKKRSSDEGQEY
jgi:hypothetical protein